MIKILVLAVLITLCSCTKTLPENLLLFKNYPGILYVIDKAPVKEDISKLLKTILAGHLWVYFILYLFISCACVWYSQRTGKVNLTLWSVRQSIENNLGFKSKILYKLLKLLKRKRK